jgi:acyl carrier protein
MVSRKKPRAMEISENDLWILSYYRESELAGALIMGRLARETDDDDLRVHLTEHCAEEANHAWLWTKAILEVGGTPRRVSETYQSRYYTEIGQPATELEVLALTQVFEKRVLSHFQDHLRWPNTHPAVVRTLERMIAEEAGHIGWVKLRLDRYGREKGEEVVAETLRRFAEVDRKVYAGLIEYRERFRELVDRGRAAAITEENAPLPPDPGSGLSRSQVEARVKRIMARSMNIAEKRLDPSASLNSLGIDSLDLVIAVSAIEEGFRIELSPTDTENLYTLDDLVGKVAELTASPSP